MKRTIWLICIGILLFTVLTGCDLYLNLLSRLGINANVEDRLKVDGQVWGLASFDGFLYAIGLEDGGPVVYKIDEELFTLEGTYQLSGGDIENKFQDHGGDNYYGDTDWEKGGRFQGYRDVNGIFYLMDTLQGGRIWLNDSDNTARFLPDNFGTTLTLFFSVGTIDFVLNYNDFTDITVTNIITSATVATLTFSPSHHLTGAVYLPADDTIQLLFVPTTTDFDPSTTTRQEVDLTVVTLDAAAVGSWSADFPYGGSEQTLDLGTTRYKWNGQGTDATDTNYVYPPTRAYYSNGDLVHVSILDTDDNNNYDRDNWLFAVNGSFIDLVTIDTRYRPVLSSSSRQLYGAFDSIILKYGVN